MYAINKTHQKEYNRSLVLHTLAKCPNLSRAELAVRLNLHKSSITPIVADLLELGVLEEQELDQVGKSGGRKPTPLCLKDNFGGVVGVDLQPEEAHLVILSLGGKPLYTERYTFSESQLSQSLLDKFVVVYRYIESLGARISCNILGISLGVPGVVNNYDGVVIHSIPFNLREYNFVEAIAELNLPVPVLIENDGNCAAWSELHNSSRSLENFLFLLFMQRHPTAPQIKSYSGVALGMGIAIDGEIYRGRGFLAGGFTSAWWTTDQTGQVGISDTLMNELAMDQLDSSRREQLLRQYIQEVLQNLIPLITALVPEKIILGGDARGKYDLIQDVIRRELGKSYLAQCEWADLFEESPHGVYATSFGAAQRFLWELFYPIVPQGRLPYYYRDIKSLFNNYEEVQI